MKWSGGGEAEDPGKGGGTVLWTICGKKYCEDDTLKPLSQVTS